jgi:O-acetyl-ADP-ribose deacetylase (regulator of RNase III)
MDAIAHRQVKNAHIFALQGDITGLPVAVIVNAANEAMSHGGGVAVAIVRAGGRVIQEESTDWILENGPLLPGKAAVTTAGSLQASHVVHVVGPRYAEDQDNEALLAQAVFAALDAVNSLDAEAAVEARSVAFPAISAGIYRYPLAEATAVIAEAVTQWLSDHDSRIEQVLLVGYDRHTAQAFAAALED